MMKLADQIILNLLKYGRRDPNEIMIPNFYMFGYEMDCFKLMKTQMVVEYEIKISRSDFFNDFKKYRTDYGKYDMESGGWTNKRNIFKHDSLRSGHSSNRFFFVVPEGLVAKNEVPAHCGLMYYTDNMLKSVGFYTEKAAPLLHKNEFTDYAALAKSLSWREETWRRKCYKYETNNNRHRHPS